jgi:hypothetical protein
MRHFDVDADTGLCHRLCGSQVHHSISFTIKCLIYSEYPMIDALVTIERFVRIERVELVN